MSKQKVVLKDLDFSFARTKRTVFQETFPHGADVTFSNARRATRNGLSLRCAAKQLFNPERFAEFIQKVNQLMAAYRSATADTREMVRLMLRPGGDKAVWVVASAAHARNKHEHWATYLEGLAQTFVDVATGTENELDTSRPVC